MPAPAESEASASPTGAQRPAKAIAAQHPAEVVELHYAMATPILIAARGDDEPRLREAVHAAFAEIRRLEAICSNFDPESDVSRVNRSAGAAATAPAPELVDLLLASKRLARATQGAFSVTVGPLVDLWQGAARRGAWPSPARLSAALRRSDGDRLVVDERSVRLIEPGMRIELGGVAKGFAADRALALLRRSGASAALVNLGGSSLAAFGDAGAERPGWPIELARPRAGVVWLHDQALSASETFGHSLEIAGRRVGHLIDPRTGQALSHDALAVVLHASATSAEALSKALIVLGRDPGFAVVAALGGEGMLVEGGRRCGRSPGFDAGSACKAVGGGHRPARYLTGGAEATDRGAEPAARAAFATSITAGGMTP